MSSFERDPSPVHHQQVSHDLLVPGVGGVLFPNPHYMPGIPEHHWQPGVTPPAGGPEESQRLRPLSDYPTIALLQAAQRFAEIRRNLG